MSKVEISNLAMKKLYSESITSKKQCDQKFCKGKVKTESKSHRDISLDAMKSIAAFLVIMTHTLFFGRTDYNDYVAHGDEYKWHICAFYTSFVRCANAVFMMVTGILLLHPSHLNDSPFMSLKMFKTRGINYLIWNIIYHFSYMRKLNWKGQLKDSLYLSILRIINGEGSFWYLYTLLFVHLATPFFQASLKTISRRTYEYCLLSYFLMYQGLNGLRLIINGWVMSTRFTNMAFFVLAGPLIYGFAEKASHPEIISGYHFVEDEDGIFKNLSRINWKKPWARAVALFVFISSVFLMYKIWSYRTTHGLPNGAFLLLDHSPFNTFAALSLFLFIYGCLSDWKPTSKSGKLLYKFFASTGSCTMGIYMLNEYLLYRIVPFIVMKWTGKELTSFNPIWFPLFISAIVYLICWILTLAAKRIPYICTLFI